MPVTRRKRSTLPKAEARQHYIEMGELMVLEQIARDAAALDQGALAVGPFARLDAEAVAARSGKTRGAINNLFGSQAVFQTETMTLVLDSSDWIERIEYPDPAEHTTEEAWVAAFFDSQSARGPAHGAEPAVDYAALWALWLSAVPYGLWSERISRAGLEEWRQWERRLEDVLSQAMAHFRLRLNEGITLTDLASAIASLVEGAWLNQCLSTQHPALSERPIADMLRRSGTMLWRGAVRRLA